MSCGFISHKLLNFDDVDALSLVPPAEDGLYKEYIALISGGLSLDVITHFYLE